MSVVVSACKFHLCVFECLCVIVCLFDLVAACLWEFLCVSVCVCVCMCVCV